MRSDESLFLLRGFRNVWGGNASSGVGVQLSTLAASVIAVSELDATPLQLGVLVASGGIANFVLGVPAGVWVDRWDKRRVLLWSSLTRASAVATVPIAAASGALSIWQLVTVALVAGVATVFFETAQISVLPRVVTRARVPEASARMQSADAVIDVVSPGAAGQVVNVVAPSVLYGVHAALEFVTAVLIARSGIVEPEREGREHEPFRLALASGIAYVVKHVVLRYFLITNALLNVGAGIFLAMIPIYALREAALSPGIYGVALSIGSLASVLGAVVAVRIRGLLGEIRTRLVMNSVAPMAFAFIPAAHLAGCPAAVSVGFVTAMFGFSTIVGSVSASGVRARATPLSMLGRVTAASRFVSLGTLPLGALIGGYIGTAHGTFVGIWTAAVFGLLAAALGWWSPLRRMRDLPLSLEAMGEHETAPGATTEQERDA